MGTILSVNWDLNDNYDNKGDINLDFIHHGEMLETP